MAEVPFSVNSPAENLKLSESGLKSSPAGKGWQMTRAGSDGLCAQNCLMEQHPATDSRQKRGVHLQW